MPPAAPTAGRPTLLFMHIPKTAGTSLRHALETLYEPAARSYVYDGSQLAGAVSRRQFDQLPARQRAGFGLVMGHFAFGIHSAIPRPARYVTMLRGPVDRVASLYFHFKLRASPPPGSREASEHAAISRGDLTLEEWAFDAGRREVDNGMLRQLLGHPPVEYGACTDEMLSQAIAVIDEYFDAVLIRGRMRESAEILGHIVGRPLPSVPRVNANSGREPVTSLEPALRRRLLELNHLDARLFDLMVERFPALHARWMS